MPPETSSAHRWFRRVLWTALAAAVALFGWMGWRVYDERAAIREAQAAGWKWESRDPVSVILADWRVAWKKETWTFRYRRLTLPDGTDLAAARPLLVRLRPTILVAAGCPNTNLDVLQNVPALQRLDFIGCEGLQTVDGLKNLPVLQVLSLSYCTGLENVDGLQNLPTLQYLDLTGCTGLQNVDSLENLPALQELGLYGCTGLQNADGLKNLPALQKVNLGGCTGLQNLDGCGNLPALREIRLIGCTKLRNVDVFKNFRALESIALHGCAGLQNVDSLKGLSALQSLNLNFCTAIPASALRELRLALPKADITFPDGTKNPPPP